MADADETPTQRAARLRREKREKKLLEGGSARLEKITGMSGRSYEATPPQQPSPAQGTPAQASPAQTATQAHDDPPEADIDTAALAAHNAHAAGTPDADAREAQLRSFLRAANDAAPPDGQADPMMQLLQQMMSGMGGMGGAAGAAGSAPGSAPGFPPGFPPGGPGAPDGSGAGLPPGLAAMLGGGLPAGPGAAAQASGRAALAWKIAHAVGALGLGAWVLVTHGFTGAAEGRLVEQVAGSEVTVFWLFVSLQLALQSGRLLLADKAAPPGMVATVAGMLPPPWGTRLRLGAQYAGMASTLVADATVLVFVLGAAAWWYGAAA